MNAQTILLALNLLIWSFFLLRLARAFRRRKLGDASAVAAWIVHLLCYLVCLLDLSTVEQAVNDFLGGVPVVLYLRSGLLLLTAQLLARMFQAADPQPRRWIAPLLSTTTGVIAVLLFLFIPAQRARLPVDQQIVVVRTLRDGLMCAWIGLFYWPLGLELWQKEQVRLMKLRDLLTLDFYSAYFVYGSTTLLDGLSIVFAPQNAAGLMQAQQGMSDLCLLLFFLLLLPARGLRVLLYPQQLYLYWRLQRLKQAVLRQSATQWHFPPLPANLLHADELELATYQNLIAVFDHYRKMEPTDPLTQEIETVLQSTTHYPDLVRRLAAVQV